MTMITPSYLGETIEYSSLHACRSTLEDPTASTSQPRNRAHGGTKTLALKLRCGSCMERNRYRGSQNSDSSIKEKSS